MADTEPEFIIRTYVAEDRENVCRLWREAGLLVNPLNDPEKDIDFCLSSGHGTIFVGLHAEALVASAMVGHDGHRGWIYYVAVSPERQGQKLGQRLTAAAEKWLTDAGIPKVQLLIRDTNSAVIGFYQRLGYALEQTQVMSKRLDGQIPSAKLKTIPDRVTITYLEMTAQPKLKAMAPPLQPLSLLRAEAPTVGFYRYLYDAVGRDWFWTDRKALSDAQLTAILNDPKVDVYVLYAGGIPAGFFELDRRPSDAIDIAYFGIISDFIGKRLGPYLLSAALRTAWSHKPQKLTINTCTLDHPSALPLYQRFGFEAIDRKEVQGRRYVEAAG